MGIKVGAFEGINEGFRVGSNVGAQEGDDGFKLGTNVGERDGEDGVKLGSIEGYNVVRALFNSNKMKRK